MAKSWSIAHIHLTDEETSALRGIPVTYARDFGFFFEPDPKTNLLELCPMDGGYIKTDPETGVSYPPEILKVSAFLPEDDEKQLRKLLAQTLPTLADRPFVKKSLCWFADTCDSDFIVDYLPDMSSPSLSSPATRDMASRCSLLRGPSSQISLRPRMESSLLCAGG